jgi:hypothetical protein
MPSQPSVSLGGRLRGAQVGSSRVPLPDLCRFGGWGRSLSFGADTLACRRLWVRVPSSASQNPLETAGFYVPGTWVLGSRASLAVTRKVTRPEIPPPSVR